MSKKTGILFVCLLSGFIAFTQTSARYNYGSFVDYQKTFQKPSESFVRKESLLKKLFELKGLKWPARYLYLRAFKYDSQLEVWAKNSVKDEYKLVKMYKICALAGTLGPKRFEGDYQVPEGFYYINEFNPNSNYYLSLGLNYPNASDKLLGDAARPGGDIYIHGGCATVGCIPIRDDQIDELYVLTASAKGGGLDFIPVHIFPINYNVKKSYEFLAKLTKENASLKRFTDKLEEAFDYFEKYKQLPIIMIRDNGDYAINDALPKVPKFQPIIRKSDHVPIVRKIDELATTVAKWPEFPGGATAYAAYLQKLGEDVVPLLPEGVTKAYVQVEFIIDKDGAPVNFKVLNGLDDFFNLELISKMERMPTWQPAMLGGVPVAKKMVQTVLVGE